MTNTRTFRQLVFSTLTAVGFAILIPLLALCIGQLGRLEQWKVVAVGETFLPFVLLPAYLVFTFAIVIKRRLLAVISAFVVLCHVFLVLPSWTHAAVSWRLSPESVHLRLFTHNTLFDNHHPDLLAEGIRDANPDVIFLQELSFANLQALKDSGALNEYRFSLITPKLGGQGSGIWSKFPLRDNETLTTPGFPTLRTTVTINDIDVRLYNVHVIAPVVGNAHAWQSSLVQLNTQIHREQPPVIVGGDFNSVNTHRPFRALLDRGFRDAHVSAGRGYARTWPLNNQLGREFRGLIGIDHILTGPHVTTVRITEGPGNGSDHRSVIADLIIGKS